jgi:hypothetical protein
MRIQPEDEMNTNFYLNSQAITEGHLCTAQAVVKQVGNVGVAMT